MHSNLVPTHYSVSWHRCVIAIAATETAARATNEQQKDTSIHHAQDLQLPPANRSTGLSG
jgi:hypothetical protein